MEGEDVKRMLKISRNMKLWLGDNLFKLWIWTEKGMRLKAMSRTSMALAGRKVCWNSGGRNIVIGALDVVEEDFA